MRLRRRLAALIGRGGFLAAVVAGVLAAGCAVAVRDPAASSAHPANPKAAEAPVPAASTTLAVGSGLESRRPADGPEQPPAPSAGGQHGRHGHPAAPAPTPTPPVVPAPGAEATTYTCPMHPEVTSTEEGRCPKCGMKLQPAPKKTPKGGAE